MDKMLKERPSISQKFADLKRELGSLSYQEWANIPEATDYSVKKQKREKASPMSDQLIESARNSTSFINAISVGNEQGTSTVLQNLNEVGEAREQLLTINLDKKLDNVKGLTNVDKKGRYHPRLLDGPELAADHD